MSLRRGMVMSLGVGLDENARTYINALLTNGATLSSLQKIYVSNLFVSLKDAGLYTKLKALYPYIGGSLTNYTLNALNPVNSNGAFRQTFVNSPTYTSLGIQHNTTNTTYARTYLNPTTHFSIPNSRCFGVYVTGAYNNCQIGVSDNSFNGDTMFLADGLNTVGEYVADGIFSAVTGNGLYILNREGGVAKKLFKNGSLLQTVNHAATVTPNGEYFLGARNTGTLGAQYGTNAQHRFAFFSEGLTDGEVGALSSIIDSFIVNFGKNI